MAAPELANDELIQLLHDVAADGWRGDGETEGAWRKWVEYFAPQAMDTGPNDKKRPADKVAGKIGGYLAGQLPGVVRTRDGAFYSPNPEKMRGILDEIVLWAPKAHAPYAATYGLREDGYPLELEAPVFPGSNRVVGAHKVPLKDRIEHAGNSANRPYFERMFAILANEGVYPLPEGLSKTDLPALLRETIETAEQIFEEELRPILNGHRPQGESGEIARPVHKDLPQTLIPDSDSPTGYIAVTPLATGAVFVELDQALTTAKEAARSEGASYRVKTTPWQAAASQKQNFGSFTSRFRGKQVAVAEAPGRPPYIGPYWIMRAHPERGVQRLMRDVLRGKSAAATYKRFRANITDLTRKPELPSNQRKSLFREFDGLLRAAVSHIARMVEQAQNVDAIDPQVPGTWPPEIGRQRLARALARWPRTLITSDLPNEIEEAFRLRAEGKLTNVVPEVGNEKPESDQEGGK